jgi:hypothetical protein
MTRHCWWSYHLSAYALSERHAYWSGGILRWNHTAVGAVPIPCCIPAAKCTYLDGPNFQISEECRPGVEFFRESWGYFSLFSLDSMRSTISAKSSQLCGDKVSLSDRPWMSSYIHVMQCVSRLWTVLCWSWSGGELDLGGIILVVTARNSNTAWWFRTNC